MVKIDISIRALFVLLVVTILLFAGTLVIAYNSGAEPNVMGHSIDEIETCSDGQILKMVGTDWTCADDTGGGATIAEGSYTGDGSTDRVIDLGFTPDVIHIMPLGGGFYHVKTASMPDCYSRKIYYDDWSSTTMKIVNNGFQLCGTFANSNSKPYTYFAMKE